MESKYGVVYLQTEMDEELLEKALFRELVRKIQDLRKRHGFKVSEKIALTLESDESTENKLVKFSEELAREVGAESVLLGELRGSFTGSLEFKGRKIEIAFERTEN